MPDGAGTCDGESSLCHLDMRAKNGHETNPSPRLRAGGRDLLQAGYPDGSLCHGCPGELCTCSDCCTVSADGSGTFDPERTSIQTAPSKQL